MNREKQFLNQAQDQTEKQQKHFRVALNKTVINWQIYIPLRINQTKTKRQNFYKNTRLLDVKKQISPYTCPVHTNKQQETLPAKVKGEKKIAQEGIQKD